MITQVFEGPTVLEAMRSVKKSLGSNATILATNEAQTSDGTKIYRVKAAVAEPVPQAAPGPSRHIGELLDAIGQLGAKVSRIEQSMLAQTDIASLETRVSELRTLLLDHNSSILDQSLTELVEPFRSLGLQLKMQGISPSIIQDVCRYLRLIPIDKSQETSVDDTFYRAKMRGWFRRKLRIYQQSDVENVRFHVFLGTQGAGRTSVLGKSAHYIKKQSGAELVLVSMDQDSLGGVETLGVYGKLLNCRVLNCASVDELLKKVKGLDPATRILIDAPPTTMVGPPKFLKELKERESSVHFHFVGSVTMEGAILESAFQRTASLGLDSFIPTFTDMATVRGNVMNIPIEWDVPLSFASKGTSIVEDYVRITSDRLLQSLFRMA